MAALGAPQAIATTSKTPNATGMNGLVLCLNNIRTMNLQLDFDGLKFLLYRLLLSAASVGRQLEESSRAVPEFDNGRR